jgi:hypothetical protein
MTYRCSRRHVVFDSDHPEALPVAWVRMLEEQNEQDRRDYEAEQDRLHPPLHCEQCGEEAILSEYCGALLCEECLEALSDAPEEPNTTP